jgi:hypothetical protein
MKPTKIKVEKLTTEQMLSHKEQEYNPAIWKQQVRIMIEKHNAVFYECKPDRIFQYTRFFAEYKIDGLHFLTQWSPFSSSLTDNGFTRAMILDGEIYTQGFGASQQQRVSNDKAGRKWLAENICKHGEMVTTSL